MTWAQGKCKRRGLSFFLAFSLSSAFAAACAQDKGVDWGRTPTAEPVRLYRLSDAQLNVSLTNYGARIVRIDAPDRQGRRADVVLGYNNAAQYLSDPKDYFGAVVGRYGNRIAKGNFVVEGRQYHVPVNNNGNALHGGPTGFSSRVWTVDESSRNSVDFELVSADGDMGFPGTLKAHVRYTLTGSRLSIEYTAETDKPTVVNLTNHTYFNLAGEASGDILGQELRLNADRYTPVDQTLIPTGELLSVSGTPFDFRKLTAIGKHINVPDEQLLRAGGYDHNFVLRGEQGTLREAAFAVDPVSGRTLTILTTEPGVQFYSGNFLDGSAIGYSGSPYRKHAGFALETQHFPDSPNHVNFPSTILRPGATYRSKTVLVFGVESKPAEPAR
jgi:aldose 1-epimerase